MGITSLSDNILTETLSSTMAQILSLTVLSCTLLGFLAIGHALSSHSSPGCFRAAILDQIMEVDASKAKSIELNLQMFEQTAKLAKEQGADIIVFPEGGILGGAKSRAHAHQIGEKVPSEKGAFCTDSAATSNPIVHRLACIAKANQMYVAADIIDVQPCTLANRTQCPPDGMYGFNTAVLFDRNGIFLAKYHKIHLFGEMTLDVATKKELVVVETEIGRLGLQICFDLLYDTPGHEMAVKGLIDTLLFPTSWFEESPFLSGSQIQMSWSIAHGVNLLAANIHQPQSSKKGSGIYSGSRQEFELVNNLNASSRLLVASLPISIHSNVKCPLNATTIKVPQKAPSFTAADGMFYFRLNMNLNDTQLFKLEAENNTSAGCFKGVCCQIEYQMDRTSLLPEDEFYMIASNRTKPGPFPIEEEFCALIHCPTSFLKCNEIRSDSPLQSKFTYIHLEGHFGANITVFPSVIGSQHQVLKQEDNGHWSYSKLIQEKNDTQKVEITAGVKGGKVSYPFGTVGLYGRAYHRDRPYVQTNIGI